jgi:hypothetical protein
MEKSGTRNGFWLISQEAEQLRQFRHHADDALIAHGLQDHGNLAGSSPLMGRIFGSAFRSLSSRAAQRVANTPA